MTKEQMLDIIKLLSAIESWSFSCGKPLPDYLHDDLTLIVGNLCDEVLGKEKTKATAEWKE